MPGPSSPKKRRITGDDSAGKDESGPAGSSTARSAGSAAPAPARKSHPNRGRGRVTPKGGGGNAPVRKVSLGGEPDGSSRYTPPSHDPADMPSPTWVPVLMFTFFGLGMITIPANYVDVLPGGTSNWYLLLGLGFILGGIVTATQYR